MSYFWIFVGIAGAIALAVAGFAVLLTLVADSDCDRVREDESLSKTAKAMQPPMEEPAPRP